VEVEEGLARRRSPKVQRRSGKPEGGDWRMVDGGSVGSFKPVPTNAWPMESNRNRGLFGPPSVRAVLFCCCYIQCEPV